MEQLWKLLSRPKSLILPALIVIGVFAAGKLQGLKQKLIDPVVRWAVPTELLAQAEGLKAKLNGALPEPTRRPGEFSLVSLRKALVTSIGQGQRDDTPAAVPPAAELELVHYLAPLGSNVAYVTPVKSETRGPAIVWITGGLGFNVDENAWSDFPRDNDQSARQLRKAGIVTMYPALRGGSQNPGHHECFLGEVDDVIAAGDFLGKRADVDPKRIYLAGHSTGGTLVLLAAESTERFRAVFSFGPVGDVWQYGEDGCLPSNPSEAEWAPRRPYVFLKEIVSPTFIIEGMKSGNGGIFPAFRSAVGGAPIQLVEVGPATHFSVLAPGLEIVAQAILADTGSTPKLNISGAAIAAAM